MVHTLLKIIATEKKNIFSAVNRCNYFVPIAIGMQTVTYLPTGRQACRHFTYFHNPFFKIVIYLFVELTPPGDFSVIQSFVLIFLPNL
ncbi:MAG: hypothetical protein ABI763_17560 [Bacteroidota bacterium]